MNNNSIDLLNKLSHAYKVYFDKFGLEWIKQMRLALLTEKEVLALSENERGSFFYQFVDFHFGAFSKQDFAKFDPNLQRFCEVCGKIESLTDSWPILEQEPNLEDKKRLLELIDKFFEIFPSPETLDTWVSVSIKNLSK